MEQAWKQVYPNDDFEYQFYDESIAKYYEAEQQTSSLLMWATGLAVFISCLGFVWPGNLYHHSAPKRWE